MAILTSKELDNSQFLIYNKWYPHARLTLTLEDFSVETTELDLSPEQLWTFEPHPDKTNCYYIVNGAYPKRRLSDSSHKLITYDQLHDDDQLFRLFPSGENDDCYYIYNYRHEEDRIAKWGASNEKVGIYSEGKNPDQLWKLVPRFKVNFHTNVVFHLDNRQNPEKIVREISVTRGIKKSSTSSIRDKATFTLAMEASLETAIKSSKAAVSSKAEFSNEIELSLSKMTEEQWSKTEDLNFTIPAFKNFKVMQHVVKFDGKFDEDSCTLLTHLKVFVSDKNEFDDPDNFIIDKTH